jgi:hypothetical protein
MGEKLLDRLSDRGDCWARALAEADTMGGGADGTTGESESDVEPDRRSGKELMNKGDRRR